ncbi:hypothetical protein PISMIDRAFT_26171 [Pisolithus microcarpus 441]|uniref:Uncharacterized protein n=1 Tax=Pisolithus microcarpus 441 TaxID=765257 RepID=A0A0C9Z119_9AGAM|nr:hypothetical protein PISMIDRAFT_26171 [Pisolithus microcarpus 441]
MAVEPFLGTRAQRAFMITKAIVVIAMVASTFGITLPCYLALFILAELFELALAYDALRLRNVIQLLGIVGFHCALIVFSALQVHETKTAIVPCYLSQCGDNPNFLWDKVMPFLVVAPCIVGASWILIIYWIKALYEEFGQPSSEQQYLSTRATLTVFTIFAFLLLLASFIVGVKCFHDFDKGLHDSKTQELHAVVFFSSDAQERDSAYSTGGAALQPQISIE